MLLHPLPPHFLCMPASRPPPYKKSNALRLATLTLGILLVIVSPIIGALPGPGFIIVFPVGLALILKSSLTAKRAYARFKHRYPKYGHWSDKALRRGKSRKIRGDGKTKESDGRTDRA